MASRAAVLLWVIALAACGGGSSSEGEPAGDTVAGKVVELTGAASIERDGTTIDLAMGSEVFGSDTVVTGAESSVVIELFHNHARWQLGANKRRVVSASAAWKAAESDSEDVLGEGAEDKTSAAGRQGERSAADTRATVSRRAVEQELAQDEAARDSAEPVAEAPPPTREPRDEPAPKKADESRAPTRSIAPNKDKPPPPPPPVPADTSSSANNSGPPGGGGGGGGSGGSGGGSTSDVDGLFDEPAGREGRSKPPKKKEKASSLRVTIDVTSVSATLDAAEVRSILGRGKSGLMRCYEKARAEAPSLDGTLRVTITVAADGTTTTQIAGGTIAPEIGPCVRTLARDLELPAPSDGQPATVEVTVTFAD